MINKLIKMANSLDSRGFKKEADMVDVILTKLADLGLQDEDLSEGDDMGELDALLEDATDEEASLPEGVSLSESELEEDELFEDTDDDLEEELDSQNLELDEGEDEYEEVSEVYIVVSEEEAAMMEGKQFYFEEEEAQAAAADGMAVVRLSPYEDGEPEGGLPALDDDLSGEDELEKAARLLFG